MITRAQIKTAILEAEKIAKPGSVMEAAPVLISVGTLRMLIEAAKVTQYEPVQPRSGESDAEYKVFKS